MLVGKGVLVGGTGVLVGVHVGVTGGRVDVGVEVGSGVAVGVGVLVGEAVGVRTIAISVARDEASSPSHTPMERTVWYSRTAASKSPFPACTLAMFR